jgi:1-deoxy-D-xylulose-5-phosphate synthase
MLITPGKLLAKIDSPEDLRKLDSSQLPQVCNELRQFIIDNVSVYGGHFGASLGVVELSVALHYVFNTPDDQLVWDVGIRLTGTRYLPGVVIISIQTVLMEVFQAFLKEKKVYMMLLE